MTQPQEVLRNYQQLLSTNNSVQQTSFSSMVVNNQQIKGSNNLVASKSIYTRKQKRQVSDYLTSNVILLFAKNNEEGNIDLYVAGDRSESELVYTIDVIGSGVNPTNYKIDKTGLSLNDYIISYIQGDKYCAIDSDGYKEVIIENEPEDAPFYIYQSHGFFLRTSFLMLNGDYFTGVSGGVVNDNQNILIDLTIRQWNSKLEVWSTYISSVFKSFYVNYDPSGIELLTEIEGSNIRYFLATTDISTPFTPITEEFPEGTFQIIDFEILPATYDPYVLTASYKFLPIDVINEDVGTPSSFTDQKYTVIQPTALPYPPNTKISLDISWAIGESVETETSFGLSYPNSGQGTPGVAFSNQIIHGVYTGQSGVNPTEVSEFAIVSVLTGLNQETGIVRTVVWGDNERFINMSLYSLNGEPIEIPEDKQIVPEDIEIYGGTSIVSSNLNANLLGSRITLSGIINNLNDNIIDCIIVDIQPEDVTFDVTQLNYKTVTGDLELVHLVSKSIFI